MKHIYYLFLLIALLSSCTDANQEDGRVRVLQDTIKSQIESLTNGQLTLSNISKIDGIEIQESTLQYNLQFEGNVIVKSDCIWDGYIYNTSTFTRPNFVKVELGNDLNKKGYTQLIKDDVIPYRGVGTFEKYDSGWKIVGVKMEFAENGVFNIIRQKPNPIESREKETSSKDDSDYDYTLVVSSDQGGDKVINEQYFAKMNGMEKAIIAYISMMGGTNCEYNDNSCTSCQLTDFLKIDCQCSNKHKDYIRHWFNSGENLEEVFNKCYVAPSGATFQRNIENIEMKRVSNTYIAKVQFWELNVRYDYSEVITNTYKFAVEGDKVTPL